MGPRKVFNSGICLFETDSKNVGGALNKLHTWAKINQVFRPNYLTFVSTQSSLFPHLSICENLELFGLDKELIDHRLENDFNELSFLFKRRHDPISKVSKVESFIFSLITAIINQSDIIVIEFPKEIFNQINLQFIQELIKKQSHKFQIVLIGQNLSLFDSISEFRFDGSEFVDNERYYQKNIKIA